MTEWKAVARVSPAGSCSASLGQWKTPAANGDFYRTTAIMFGMTLGQMNPISSSPPPPLPPPPALLHSALPPSSLFKQSFPV